MKQKSNLKKKKKKVELPEQKTSWEYGYKDKVTKTKIVTSFTQRALKSSQKLTEAG